MWREVRTGTQQLEKEGRREVTRGRGNNRSHCGARVQAELLPEAAARLMENMKLS